MSKETMKDVSKLTAILEEINLHKAQAQRQGKKENKKKLEELRAKFKELAVEVFKEMYGFYNTEKGGGPGGLVGGMMGD